MIVMQSLLIENRKCMVLRALVQELKRHGFPIPLYRRAKRLREGESELPRFPRLQTGWIPETPASQCGFQEPRQESAQDGAPGHGEPPPTSAPTLWQAAPSPRETGNRARQPGLEAQSCGWPPPPMCLGPVPVAVLSCGSCLPPRPWPRMKDGGSTWDRGGAGGRGEPSGPKATVISRQSWAPRGMWVPGPLQGGKTPGKPLSPRPTWGWGRDGRPAWLSSSSVSHPRPPC